MFYYYYYERIWLKCHKIQGTARTLYKEQDAFRVIRETKRKMVRHSPGQSIGGKVLFWGGAGQLSVILMSTRWHWMAGCSIRTKPRPEMHGRQLTAYPRYDEHRRWRWPQPPSQVYVRHSVEFFSKMWRSRRVQTTVREHRQLKLNPLRHPQPV